MEFRKDINGLRAVAVALVLLYHFDTPGFGAGFIGVDVFFVISGFLMTGIIMRGLDRGSFSLPGFYRARFERLYPALLATVAATLVFGTVFLDPVALEQMARHAISAVLFVSNIVFWRESGYFAGEAEASWFLHTWSLSVEWQCYLLYPIVLVVAGRWLRSRQAWFALLAAGFAASLGLAVLVGEILVSSKTVSAGFYMLPMRAFEMIGGSMLALAPALSTGARLRALMQAAGLTAIAASLVLFSRDTPWPSYDALLPVAGAMLVMAARSAGPLDARPLQLLGSASYSIYLWHWPVVCALALSGAAGPLSAALGLVLSLGLGIVSWRLIEVPSRNWLRARSALPGTARAAGPAVLAAATACVAIAAQGIVAGHGLPLRNPAAMHAIETASAAAADYTYPNERCGGLPVMGGRLKPCVVGTPSQDDVLVLGDSFAEMWYPRVAARAGDLRGRAVEFLTMGGCPPIAGLERTTPGLRCGAFHELAADEARSARFGTVILAGMWTSYFDVDTVRARLCDASGCAASTTPEGLAKAEAALGGLVRELRLAGKRVVILTTSPYPEYDVPRELRRQAFASGTIPSDWRFEFAEVTAAAQPIDSVLRDMRLYGAEIVDLQAELCGEGPCAALADGVPLYTDASHIRSSHAVIVGGFLDRYILPDRLALAR